MVANNPATHTFGSVLIDGYPFTANYGECIVPPTTGDTFTVTSSSVILTAISTAHEIIPTFVTRLYSITWSGMTGVHGKINNAVEGSITGIVAGGRQSFSLTADTDYETATVVVDGNSVAAVGATTYEIYPVVDDYVVSATFRVQIPSQVTGVTCVITDADTNTIAWSQSSRMVGYTPAYTVYWSTTEPTDAETLISTGTAITPTTGLTITHDSIDTSVPYYYTVLASNSTGRATLGSVVVDNQNAMPMSTLTASLPTRPLMRTGYSIPMPSAINVPVTIVLKASMNVETTSASMTESFKLYSNAARTTVVPGAISQESTLVWLFTPTSNLASGTKYYPRVSEAAKSSAGIPVRNEIIWEFTTA